MKTRMHRFWLSITLAATSLASPLSQNLMSHDLPTRWSPAALSGPNADSDWNYLLDDCLDSRQFELPNHLSAPVKGSLADDASALAGGLDFDALLSRNSLAKLTSDMACWANHWEQLQAKAARAGRTAHGAHGAHAAKDNLVAARPEFGYPPAPALAIVDTCNFEVQYQAMQAAAEQLAEQRDASKAIDEAGLTRSLAAAAELEAAAVDAVDAVVTVTPEPARCGGETSEIVSVNRSSGNFAAAPLDEYMSYDIDPRDAHWLGGLGKSWKLGSALRAPQFNMSEVHSAEANAGMTDSEGAIDRSFTSSSPDIEDDAAELTAEDFAAADLVKETEIEDVGGPVQVDATANSTAAIYEGYVSDAVDVAEPVVDGADHKAHELLSLKDHLSDALQWLEDTSCIISAEMCDMDSASKVGQQWGQLALSAAEQSMTNYVAMGHYLELPPAVANPTLDIVVVYTDIDGQQMSVPGSLARAWNQADYDNTADAADAPILDPYDAAVSDFTQALPTSAPAASQASKASLSELLPQIDMGQLRREILSLVAAKLDSLGITCLEAADRLTNWAETQIASRDDSDIR